MLEVYRIDVNGYFIEPVLLFNGESVPKDCVTIKPPQGLAKPQYLNGAWTEGMAQSDILNTAKALKKAELSQKCYQTIIGGFSSSALGAAHTYPSDEEAQRNFHSELDRIRIDSTYTTIYFKTFDSGYLAHTIAQFNQVFIDGHTFGRQQISHLNDLKAQVDVAATADAVNAITW